MGPLPHHKPQLLLFSSRHSWNVVVNADDDVMTNKDDRLMPSNERNRARQKYTESHNTKVCIQPNSITTNIHQTAAEEAEMK